MRFTHAEAVAIRRAFMRTVIVGFAAVLLAAQAACAASILYATAATTGGVDGFCIRGDGSLSPAPKVHVDTAGAQPRRLLVANDTLYVAEVDRIEAFRIGASGALRLLTTTMVKADPRDMALNPDGKTLYVTHRGFISAFRVNRTGDNTDGGLLPEETCAGAPPGCIPTPSCVQGVASANYLDLQVTNGLLYASADDAPGRIEVYGLNCDGSLPEPLDGLPRPPQAGCNPSAQPPPETPQIDCGPPNKKHAAKAPIWPYSERTKIQKPKALIVSGEMIYVEERANRRLIAFRLQPDGTFCDKKKNRTDKNDILSEDCTGFDQLPSKKCARKQAKKQRQQCVATATSEVLQYEGVVLHPSGESLIGAQFFKGRVDSYRLQPDERLGRCADGTTHCTTENEGTDCVGQTPPACTEPRTKLPTNPTVQSEQDARMTPVRLVVDGNRVYVAGGELNRVVAYYLTGAGVLASQQPFSRTDEVKDSFPNDVAISMLSAACE
jgi:hypothetical protein